MALLNSTYKSPQANILFGAGNSSITDQQIKDFISTPGRTNDEIKGAALNHNINVDQISRAMAGHDAYSPERLEGYLKSQGITKEPLLLQRETPPQAIAYQPAATPAQVNPSPITIDPTKDTVAGQMGSLISDSNNPLNVQAQTFGNQQANRRGLLNSSIATSAAQDAMYKNLMPIATQDAGTYYDSKKTNSAQGLQAGMFNADLGSRVGMFNADQGLRAGMFNNEMARDYANINKDYFTSTLDANTRMNVANMQVRSAETGIMGDLSKTYMELYARIAADPNMSPDAKKEAVANVQSAYTSTIGLMDTLASAAKKIGATFGGDNLGSAASPGGDSTSGGIANAGGNQQASDPLDPKGMAGGGAIPSGATSTTRNDGARAYMPGNSPAATGAVFPKSDGKGYIVKAKQGLRPFNIDTSTIALDVNDLANISVLEQNIGGKIDPQDVVPSSLIESIQTSYIQLGDSYAPIPVPGSKRGDNILLNIWKAALPKYQK